MEATGYVALSRQVTLERQMEITANNIANANTAGFRQMEVAFEPVRHDGGEQNVSYVQSVRRMVDLTEGAITVTGNPLDMALSGDGFFVVQTPDGERYTRAGHFQINAESQLVNSQGHQVLDDGGNPIELPEEVQAITVTADGLVLADEDEVAILDRVRFDDPSVLKPAGGGLLMSDAAPQPAPETTVQQGMIEGSNVQPVLAMTEMMQTVRAFEATQKLIETDHQLARQAVERLLSVQS